MKISSDELKKKWIDFWREKNHAIISSARVVPENDPTALFINSGMHPLVPFFGGESHPAGKKIANAQKCIRTGDIDEVGDSTHLTFFEMLGNWSFGDYFKKEQIFWSFEFLIKILKLPLEKIAVSVFAGDENSPRDDDAFNFWHAAGIPKNRIAFLPASENWWEKGKIGPCGPDTEIFFWTGKNSAPENFQKNWENENWVEIWNNVFMQFEKLENGKLKNLSQKNIDTGMGFERTVAVLNGKKSVFETDIFSEILQKIAEIFNDKKIFLSPAENSKKHFSARILADHCRAAVVILADGILPSNTDAGYILRRILRRAILHLQKFAAKNFSIAEIAKIAIQKLGKNYPEILQNEKKILDEIANEEKIFLRTLKIGEKKLEKICDEILEKNEKNLDEKKIEKISGKIAFDLFQTFGFPLEMTAEIAAEKNLTVDEIGFKKEFAAHQKLSRAGAEKKFAGGVSGADIEKEKLLHTATHLLHAALKKFLDKNVEQRGSNITPERLRFDFNFPEKVAPKILQKIENWINEIIQKNVEISCAEMSLEAAKKLGATGIFEKKYGEKVRVFSIGNFSCEICGGPHAKKTGELGKFKIQKEKSSGRGIRRIRAILEK